MENALHTHAGLIESEQDQVAAMNRHSDPNSEIIASWIGGRHLENALATRFQLIEKGYRSGDVIADLFQIELGPRR